MNKSMRGALLSGLVFPGLGQVVLKHYKRGIALIFTVSVGLIVLVVKAVQKALTILGKIESEGGVINMSAISNAATEASAISNSFIFNLALLLIIFCWVFGTIDAYRIGKKKDSDEQSIN